MSDIILISGSPTLRSRSGALLEYAAARLVDEGLKATTLSIRDYPPEDLILGRYDSPAFNETKRLVAEARGIVVGTPVYKASFTGSLKALLDILPVQAFRNKTLLPIASGGSAAHLLVLDYALKPVLSALGASDILQGVYVTDPEVQFAENGEPLIDEEIRTRLGRELESLISKVTLPAPV